MVDMPEPVMRMVVHPDTNKALSTVSLKGEPHVIVCGSLMVTAPNMIAVAEAFMYRTAENLCNNHMAEILIWKGREAYSLKVKACERVESGPVFDKMSRSLEKMHMTLDGVWIFEVLEIWDEGIGNMTGSRIV
ncbi:MAG: hypothetical protein IKQ60_09370 [Candidatus Methanomethylophilaceae archaeon]|nr:hypothetical protein [Candidatus Methanomethylophilaceae archaeon]